MILHGTVSDNTVALDRKTATPIIINGDMQIAQRGTSVTGITSTGFYTIDRFRTGELSLGTWTQSQSTDVPTGQSFSSSLKMDCTTADASPAASDNLGIITKIEGQNLQLLKKGTSDAEYLTVAFWVKSAKTGTYILELFDVHNTRIIVQAYTISSANTWEKKVLSFAGDTTGALDNDNTTSLQLRWWLGSGTTFTSGTLATSWGAQNNANRAVGQVNLADSTSNDWYLTGVQIEVGQFDANSIPDFQFEDRATSLARCQRYTQVFGGNSIYETFCSGSCNTATVQTFLIKHNTTMRTTPSISVTAVGDFQVVSPSAFSETCTAITITTNNSGQTMTQFQTNTSSNSNSVVGRVSHFRTNNSTDSKFTLSAEL
jgi:hypothetical protein